MSDEIRVLAVRQPWASLIVEGLKTIEVRSRPTNIRKRVAIYVPSSQTKAPEIHKMGILDYVTSDDKEKCVDVLENVKRESNNGKIIGTVYIDSSTTHPVISSAVFNINHKFHLAPDIYFNENGVHFWYLTNPVKFSKPIPYKPPKGAVVWSKTVLPEGY